MNFKTILKWNKGIIYGKKETWSKISHDKLQWLCIQYYRVYGHQIWRDGNLHWCVPTNKSTQISTNTMSVVIKCWQVGDLPLHKLTWCFNHVVFRDQITNWNISPLPQCLWWPNLRRWWLTLTTSYQSNHMMLWVCGLARSCDNITSFHHHYHSFYDYQTWHNGHWPWAAPIHKVSEPMVLQDQMTN